MTRTLLLTLHICGVAAWLGANLVQLVVARLYAKADAGAARTWTEATQWLGRIHYPLAGAVISVSGVLLVLDGDWSWSAGFVLLGIATVVVGAALGVVLFNPLAERRASALAAGDLDAARAPMRTILPAAWFDTTLVVVTVLAMVDKWLP